MSVSTRITADVASSSSAMARSRLGADSCRSIVVVVAVVAAVVVVVVVGVVVASGAPRSGLSPDGLWGPAVGTES